MATWEWQYQGKTVRGEGETEGEAWQNFLRSVPVSTYPTAPSVASSVRSGIKDVTIGFGQGALDPIEGLIQLAEKGTGLHLAPQWLRNWAHDYRTRAQSTTMGQIGEVAGNIFNPAYLIPGVAPARAATLGGRALIGAGAGLTQPVEGDSNYWKTKGWQAAAGALGGSIAPTLGSVMAKARGLTPHWSSMHPGASVAGMVLNPVVGGTGELLERIPPGPAGRAAGRIFEEDTPPEKERR